MPLRTLAFAFNRLELVVANLSLVTLVAILAVQVFFRYVLHQGIGWSEEVSRFAFVWFVYISASLAAQRGTHIRVTVATKWFPGGKRVALMVADAVWIVFNAFVVIAGLLLIERMLKYPAYSTSLFIPLAWVYTVIPIAHALMIVRIIQRQWIAWKLGISVLPEDNQMSGGPGQ